MMLGELFLGELLALLKQANPGDLVAATWKQSSAFAEQSR